MRTSLNLKPLKEAISKKEGSLTRLCTNHSLDYFCIRNALSGKRPLAESIFVLCEILEIDPFTIWQCED